MSGEDLVENGSSNGNGNPRGGFGNREWWTPERRLEASERARKLHSEGRLGGRQPGAGRPRKKRVSEVIVEEAEKEGQIIWNKLREMLRGKDPSLQLQAIDRIIAREDKLYKDMKDDEREAMELTGKELQEKLEEVLLSVDYEMPSVDVEEVVDDNSMAINEMNGEE